MSSRVVDEQNVEKQFTSSEIVSNADNFEMVPSAPSLLDQTNWKNVGVFGPHRRNTWSILCIWFVCILAIPNFNIISMKIFHV
jgi:hypothetical protein